MIRAPFIRSGAFLGMGLGAFVDGIAFHQLLQWHGMVSSRRPPTNLVNLEVNMFWDGVFYLGAWLATGIGAALLWRTRRVPSLPGQGRLVLAGALIGWGGFNIADGILHHHLLDLHHIRTGPHQNLADGLFLALSAALVIAGLALLRPGRRQRLPRSEDRIPLRGTP